MNFLVDTNIFLEILLGQPNKGRCKSFLQENTARCAISDFAAHSIGVICYRSRRQQVYQAFLSDIFPATTLLHLDKQGYAAVLQSHQRYGLDFDDAYHFTLARSCGLTLVTQDSDFDRVKAEVSLRFL
ncbi:MAG TPA: PIN domain-containing protein [Verrucomicrobiota bacterium]|jgi:predicted nucleic acid-binding protein|nr:PIN domain-containing protein [Verrucomicrobiota bacterium]HRT56398.1 PIN domain-containing protein [Candidatus Paceibacterota bacterium]